MSRAEEVTDTKDPLLAGGSVRLYAPAVLVFLVSLAATVFFCRSMSGGMAMPGGWTMSMMWMRMPGQGWPASVGMFLLMWLAMMVAMMLPSATPMFMRFRPRGAAAMVACGYFTVWTAVGLVVYGLGTAWALAVMRWESVSRAAPPLTGALLVLAGAHQFSPWKRVGLARCRDPRCGAGMENESGRTAMISQGLREGVFCVVCCAGPMLAMLALGAMNPMAMIVVAVLIGLEKLLPDPRPVVSGAGLLGIGAGASLLVAALFH